MGSVPGALTSVATFALTFGNQLCVQTGACSNEGLKFDDDKAKKWAKKAARVVGEATRNYGGYNAKRENN